MAKICSLFVLSLVLGLSSAASFKAQPKVTFSLTKQANSSNRYTAQCNIDLFDPKDSQFYTVFFSRFASSMDSALAVYFVKDGIVDFDPFLYAGLRFEPKRGRHAHLPTFEVDLTIDDNGLNHKTDRFHCILQDSAGNQFNSNFVSY